MLQSQLSIVDFKQDIYSTISETTDPVFESENSTYQLIKTKIDWFDAGAHCPAIGGHIAAFETEEEFSSISAHIPDERYHFGLNDVKEEGKYVWAHSGQELGTYQPWAPSEPHDVWYEDCAFLEAGRWKEMQCDPYYSYHFICEFPKQ